MKYIYWELKRAFRSKATLFSVVLYAVFILMSSLYGHNYLVKQQKIIDQLSEISVKNDQLYFTKRFGEQNHIGRALYYLSNYVVHEPLAVSALSIGVRDLHSYHQVIRMRSLYTYLFDSGLNNPEMSSNGHFDLAFVIIFLLPLLLICSSYDVLSSDKESGMFRFLKNAGGSLRRVALTRLGVRLLLFVLVTSILYCCVFYGLSLSLNSFWSWYWVSLCYMSFWFGVIALVISLEWSTSKNTATLLVVWSLFNLVFPSLLNIIISQNHTKSGSMVMIKARQVVNNGWDIEKEVTAAEAKKHFPLYRDSVIAEENFNWTWYYAMQDVGDHSADGVLKQYFESLEHLYNKTAQWSLFIPSVQLQMIFNRLSGTDQKNHIHYYQEILAAKNRMRQKFLPRVIAGEKMSKKELLELPESLKVETYTPSQSLNGMNRLSFTLILSLIHI